jgi:hypothetical protein
MPSRERKEKVKHCPCGRKYLALGVRRPHNFFFYEIDNHNPVEFYKMLVFAVKRLRAFKLFRTVRGYHLVGELRKGQKWKTVWNYFKRRIKTDFRNSKKHGFFQVLRVSAKYNGSGRIINPAPRLILSYGVLRHIHNRYFLIYWTKKK